jgi:hypothetical protein
LATSIGTVLKASVVVGVSEAKSAGIILGGTY